MNTFTRMHFFLLICIIVNEFFHKGRGQIYNDTFALFKDKLNSGVYNVQVPPVVSQSGPIKIGVGFQLLSIVGIDDVAQSFSCNGLISFYWNDQLIRWNPDDYGGKSLIHPKARHIWRPKVVLINTLQDQDIFSDTTEAPLLVTHDGTITWIPGSVFLTSCQLDLSDYPFDEQTCSIKLISMGLVTDELQFVAIKEDIGTSFSYRNGEWAYLGGKINIINFTTDLQKNISGIQFSFRLRRKPLDVMLTTVLPILFLSFMNLMVFIIPSDSEEKIGFGMTVLLALSVFMSNVGKTLPSSSETIPRLTIYLFCLLIVSLLTVIDTIIIVSLYGKGEKEDKREREKENLPSTTVQMNPMPKADGPLVSPSAKLRGLGKTRISSETEKTSKTNKCATVGKHINGVSFVVFLIIWISLTMGFMIKMSTR